MDKQTQINAEAEKERKLQTVAEYLKDEGFSIDDLKKFQTSQVEVTKDPEIRPSQLDGVSNDPVLDNSILTARLVELERRFKNLIASEHADKY